MLDNGYALRLYNGASDYGRIKYLNGIEYQGYGGHHFLTYSNGSYNEKLTITESGNVGIGISSPVAKLDVAGDGTGPSVHNYAYATNSGARIYGAESALDIVGYDNGSHASSLLIRNSTKGFGFVNNPNLDALELKSFTTNNDGFNIHGSGVNVSSLVDILTIEKAGNVGINTSNPSDKLDVQDGYIRVGFTGGAQFKLIPHSSNDGYGFYDVTNANYDMWFDGGNVGIGTTNPSCKLDISGSGNQKLLVDRTDGDNFFIDAQNGQIRLRGSSNIYMGVGSDVLAVTSSNVGIGTTNPSQKLHVNSGVTNHVATFESSDSTAEITIKDDTKYTRLLTTGNNFKIIPDNGSQEFIFEGDTGDMEIATNGQGLILRSPNGTRYRLTVDNSGNLTTSAV